MACLISGYPEAEFCRFNSTSIYTVGLTYCNRFLGRPVQLVVHTVSDATYDQPVWFQGMVNSSNIQFFIAHPSFVNIFCK